MEQALHAERLRPDDLMALLSPAAGAYLEPMARKAHRLTLQRFGRNILLYAPLYISNVCTNGCLYCGFSATNKVPRRTLTLEEVEREARILHDQGFRHILLVTGESPRAVDNDFLAACVTAHPPSVQLHLHRGLSDGQPTATGRWLTPASTG